MAKGVRLNIETYTLAGVTGIVDENKTLAHLVSAEIKWHLRDGKPLGEISQLGKVIWRESYHANYFHIAYACMHVGMNKQLKQMLEQMENAVKHIK